ncbi:MAG: nuclear transport factor 2 family protein [Candidatus Bathyarchaeota archaeon]|nr:MAG: nuclear transport factor 2 family protein [Candidatus Bathyarchaeota archaeon]
MDSFDVMVAGLKFHEKINRRDLEGLVELMTYDHIFIDNSGDRDKNMKEGWRRFFSDYP